MLRLVGICDASDCFWAWQWQWFCLWLETLLSLLLQLCLVSSVSILFFLVVVRSRFLVDVFSQTLARLHTGNHNGQSGSDCEE